MPGIAAKVFVHVQDWTAAIVCPVAVAEVFALANATAEVLPLAGGVSKVISVSDAVPEINCE